MEEERSKKLIKIGVLMGGRSIEREISFNSGRTVCDNLDIHRYEAIPIFQKIDGSLFLLPWHFIHRGKISDFEYRLEDEAKKINWEDLENIVDFVYCALHGKFGEDGSIQAMLEFLKIPYSGSSFLTGAISSNKNFHSKILNFNNIKTPKEIIIKKNININADIDLKNKLIDFLDENKTLIIKPNLEGSSLGVSIVNNLQELLIGIELARNIDNITPQDVLIQEKINGIEFSLICIEQNNEWIALEPTEIAHKKENYIFEYLDKYMPGMGEKYTPMRICKENILKIKDECIKIAKVLEAKDIIRIDGFLNEKNEIVIIESNIFPGTSPSCLTFLQSSVFGISNSELINIVITNAMKRYGDKFKLFMEKTIEIESRENKLRVGIIFGGGTNEKEVSLESGRNIFNKISSSIYEKVPLFLTPENKIYKIRTDQIVKNRTIEIYSSLEEEQEIKISKLKDHIDFMFIGLHGGIGENGCLQGVLDTLNIPYSGSGILANSLCMDKYKANKILKANGIDTPENFIINKNFSNEKINNLFLELKNKSNSDLFIVKPNDDGCSFMINICNSFEEILNYKNEIFSTGKESCMVEEFIDAMELTIGVLGNENPIVFPPTYTAKTTKTLSLEEKFLPGAGENITPAPLEKSDIEFIKNKIKEVYLILQCSGYSRIDCFFKKNENERKLIILEINTLPAMTPATCLFHQSAELGIRPADLIDKIINLGLSK